jgi:hypothetical protein
LRCPGAGIVIGESKGGCDSTTLPAAQIGGAANARPLFLLEFRGGPRAINPDQSVKPSYKKGMALSKRCCFFGMVTPNPHARQNSPIRVE